MTRKRLLTAAFVLATAVSSSTISAATARPASAARYDCLANQMCFWHNQAMQGTFFWLSNSAAGLGGNSDEAHSLWNRTSVAWIVYDDANYGDRRFCILSGKQIENIGDNSHKFGDKISSAKRLTANVCPPGEPIG